MWTGISWLRVGTFEHNNDVNVKVFVRKYGNAFFPRTTLPTVQRAAAFVLIREELRPFHYGPIYIDKCVQIGYCST
jgi:hypothetical protein